MCQRLPLDDCPGDNNDHVESNTEQMNAEAHAFKKQKFLEFQKFHYISMINALVSKHFGVPIYALFLGWKEDLVTLIVYSEELLAYLKIMLH